jgi:hypothetical protein
MKERNKSYINPKINNPLPAQKIVAHPHKQNYLKMKRQKEIDAMVEFTRYQLIDSYDG